MNYSQWVRHFMAYFRDYSGAVVQYLDTWANDEVKCGVCVELLSRFRVLSLIGYDLNLYIFPSVTTLHRLTKKLSVMFLKSTCTWSV